METMTEPSVERRRYSSYANSLTTPAVLSRPLISWGAVFAGVFMGIAVQVLLSALGVGIGGAAVNPGEGTSMSGLGTGALIWLGVSTIIAYFASGWTAGRSAGFTARGEGLLHGLVTWSISLVLTTILLTTAIGGALSGAAKLVGGLGHAAQSAPPAVRNTINNELQQRGINPNVINNGSPGQVQSQVNQAANQVQSAMQNPQVQQQAQQAGEAAAKGTAAAGFGGFGLLLISAIACAWGGSVGIRRARLSMVKV